MLALFENNISIIVLTLVGWLLMSHFTIANIIKARLFVSSVFDFVLKQELVVLILAKAYALPFHRSSPME